MTFPVVSLTAPLYSQATSVDGKCGIRKVFASPQERLIGTHAERAFQSMLVAHGDIDSEERLEGGDRGGTGLDGHRWGRGWGIDGGRSGPRTPDFLYNTTGTAYRRPSETSRSARSGSRSAYSDFCGITT